MFGGDKRRFATEAVELNVLPVMNLFMVLIPFLLLGAAFIHLAVIPTATPSHDPQQSDVPKTPKTVSMSLVVKKDGVRLTAQSTSLTPEELEELATDIPRKPKGYDLVAIQDHLADIKNRYPKSNTLTVLPYDDISYQELVEVLDVTREQEVGKDPNGDPAFAELFPVTIFSRLLIEDVKPGEGEGVAESVDPEGDSEGGGDEGGEE